LVASFVSNTIDWGTVYTSYNQSRFRQLYAVFCKIRFTNV